MNDNHEADAAGELGSTAGAEGKESQAGPGQQGEQGVQGPANKVVRVHAVRRVVPVKQAEPTDPPEALHLSVPQPSYAPLPPWQVGSPPLPAQRVDAPPVPNRAPSHSLFNAYRQAFLHPSAEGMASEVPGASWFRVWTGLIIASTFYLVFALVGALFALVYALITGQATHDISATAASQGSLGTTHIGSAVPGFFESSLITLSQAVWSVLTYSACFLLDALLLYRLSHTLGGVGRTGNFRSDFKVHSYLLSLVAVPVSIVSGAASFIPGVGGVASFAILIYGIVLEYYAVRASMQLTRSKARSVIIRSIIVIFALVFVLIQALALFIRLTGQFSGTHR